MNTSKEFLATAPIGRLLFKLALPTVLAQLINMLYNVVDRIFIGHIEDIGADALTGVGVCMPLIMLVSAFAALVSSGGAPRASIFMGKGEKDNAEKTLGNCFSVQIIISLVLTLILVIFSRDLLLAFGASENTIEYAASYMSIYAIGTVFVQLTLGMNSFITAQGFSKFAMISIAVGAITNIMLDPIFIFGLGMGVSGAALATVISQGASTVFCILFLLSDKAKIKIKIKNLKPEAKIILPCIALGTAAFIMQSSESVISICFNSSLQLYGGDIAVGAMTVLTSVMQFAMMPLQGIAQGAQPILSFNFGAKNSPRVKRTFKILLTVCLTYSALLWSAIMLFPGAFASIFSSDTAFVSFSSSALPVYCAVLFVFGIQIACQMTFVSLGNAPASILVAVVRKFVLLLPLIYVMPLIVSDKVMAIYTAEPVADIIAVSFTAVLFYFTFKKQIKSIEVKNQ